MFYLAAYACMNIGVFAVIVHISGKGERHLSIDDFAGLGMRQPLIAGLLVELFEARLDPHRETAGRTVEEGAKKRLRKQMETLLPDDFTLERGERRKRR